MVYLSPISTNNWNNTIPFFQAKILDITCFTDLMRFSENFQFPPCNKFQISDIPNSPSMTFPGKTGNFNISYRSVEINK